MTEKNLSGPCGELLLDCHPSIQGEKLLLIAMVERAVLDLLAYKSGGIGTQYLTPEDGITAREWLLDKEATEQDEFSFAWVCENLDCNKDVLLEKIKEKIGGEI